MERWQNIHNFVLNRIRQKNLSTMFKPLTPKIWLLILPSSFYTFLCKMVMRIWWSIKVISCTWWVWVFSLPVCQIMYEHYREKLRVYHFWELKGLNKTFQNLFQLLSDCYFNCWKLWSVNRSASGLCFGICSVSDVYHTHFWSHQKAQTKLPSLHNQHQALWDLQKWWHWLHYWLMDGAK